MAVTYIIVLYVLVLATVYVKFPLLLFVSVSVCQNSSVIY